MNKFKSLHEADELKQALAILDTISKIMDAEKDMSPDVIKKYKDAVKTVKKLSKQIRPK